MFFKAVFNEAVADEYQMLLELLCGDFAEFADFLLSVSGEEHGANGFLFFRQGIHCGTDIHVQDQIAHGITGEFHIRSNREFADLFVNFVCNNDVFFHFIFLSCWRIVRRSCHIGYISKKNKISTAFLQFFEKKLEIFS